MNIIICGFECDSPTFRIEVDGKDICLSREQLLELASILESLISHFNNQ